MIEEYSQLEVLFMCICWLQTDAQIVMGLISSMRACSITPEINNLHQKHGSD